MYWCGCKCCGTPIFLFSTYTRTNACVTLCPLHRLRLGDTVHVTRVDDVRYAKRVTVAVFADSIEGISGDVYDVYVKPYFKDKYRPIKKGDIFISRGAMRSAEFKVMDVEFDKVEGGNGEDNSAVDYCKVGDETEIVFEVKEAIGEFFCGFVFLLYFFVFFASRAAMFHCNHVVNLPCRTNLTY